MCIRHCKRRRKTIEKRGKHSPFLFCQITFTEFTGINLEQNAIWKWEKCNLIFSVIARPFTSILRWGNKMFQQWPRELFSPCSLGRSFSIFNIFEVIFVTVAIYLEKKRPHSNFHTHTCIRVFERFL